MRFKLSKTQTLELSKYWFDLSKLSFGSLILKLFEPGAPNFTPLSFGIIFWGLALTIIFAMIGLQFSRKIK